ncbi:hypothetical protein [Pseudotabrizicola sp. L79]|uniref:hypothetical protein n=1 Tax=Pseudotabrizicola sp. L79 TaxID=3118402 RepID=UPI002F943A90
MTEDIIYSNMCIEFDLPHFPGTQIMIKLVGWFICCKPSPFARRPHSSLDGKTRNQACFNLPIPGPVVA